MTGTPLPSHGSTSHRKAAIAIHLATGLFALSILVCAALFWLMASWRYSTAEKSAMLIAAVAFGVGLFFVANAVSKRKAWGRVAGIVLGAAAVPFLPFGTLWGGYVLFHLVIGWKGDTDAA